MLATKGETLEGKVCSISGSGNVAQYAAQKLIQLGAKVVTLSDRSGWIYAKDGLSREQVDAVKALKGVQRGELSDLAKKDKSLQFHAEGRPWAVPVDCAFPCARQNELDGKDAETLLKNGCKLVGEGANMPSTPEAVEAFVAAVSGLEMSQNSERLSWSAEEVDARLKGIMKAIHDNAYEAAKKYGKKGNYVVGANIAGFTKVADAMVAQGLV